MKDISPWIYVSERKPKHLEIVMIPYANPLGYKLAMFMEHGITRPEEKDFFCRTSEVGFDDLAKYYNVKAWLPVPKPDESVMPRDEFDTTNDFKIS